MYFTVRIIEYMLMENTVPMKMGTLFDYSN